MEQNSANAEWKWDGDATAFIGMVKWALVYRKLGKENPKRLAQIYTNPGEFEKAFTEFGITDWAVAKELGRISKEALEQLDTYEAIQAISKMQLHD